MAGWGPETFGGSFPRHESLELARAYLGEFDVIDRGRILPEDFVRARELAAPRKRITARRTFADCLIRAIADRLTHDVLTYDKGFPG